MTLNIQRLYQRCNRCVSDTNIPSIQFDSNGICNYCHAHDRLAEKIGSDEKIKIELATLVDKIKLDGKGKEYDCIVGLSGGTDSSYTLHKVVELGLRPLAVHFDNGWNTDASVSNIKFLTSKLNVDLDTYVVDWEEFKDLQLSFLKASTPCLDAPTDVGIFGSLYKAAKQFGVKYILGGQSYKTEGTIPREWTYIDGTYVKSVHKLFGKKPLKTFPNVSLSEVFYYTFIKRIKIIPFLNYFDYDKEKAKLELKEIFGWKDYGGNHYENSYTRFAFGWYLPKKFGIDKRIVYLSGPVRSGLMSRDEAIAQLNIKPIFTDDFIHYCLNKLGLTQKEFEELMNLPKKTYKDFYTSENIFRYVKKPVKIAVNMGFFTPVLYEKYFEGI